MSKSHSPGPWTHRDTPDCAYIVAPDGAVVAMVQRECDAGPVAAVPSMLALLKEIDATWPVTTSELRDRVRKVIAEAEANGQAVDK